MAIYYAIPPPHANLGAEKIHKYAHSRGTYHVFVITKKRIKTLIPCRCCCCFYTLYENIFSFIFFVSEFT